MFCADQELTVHSVYDNNLCGPQPDLFCFLPQAMGVGLLWVDGGHNNSSIRVLLGDNCIYHASIIYPNITGT